MIDQRHGILRAVGRVSFLVRVGSEWNLGVPLPELFDFDKGGERFKGDTSWKRKTLKSGKSHELG
jgi:hypothetical protein